MKAFRDGKYLHRGRLELLQCPFVLSDHLLFNKRFDNRKALLESRQKEPTLLGVRLSKYSCRQRYIQLL